MERVPDPYCSDYSLIDFAPEQIWMYGKHRCRLVEETSDNIWKIEIYITSSQTIIKNDIHIIQLNSIS